MTWGPDLVYKGIKTEEVLFYFLPTHSDILLSLKDISQRNSRVLYACAFAALADYPEMGSSEKGSMKWHWKTMDKSK